MLHRLIAWAVFAVLLVGAARLVGNFSNPWHKPGPTAEQTAKALHIPGCADHKKDCG